MKRERFGIPFTGLSLPHFCACPWICNDICLGIFLCSVSLVKMKGFVGIVGLDYHHCLNFLSVLFEFQLI